MTSTLMQKTQKNQAEPAEQNFHKEKFWMPHLKNSPLSSFDPRSCSSTACCCAHTIDDKSMPVWRHGWNYSAWHVSFSMATIKFHLEMQKNLTFSSDGPGDSLRSTGLTNRRLRSHRTNAHYVYFFTQLFCSFRRESDDCDCLAWTEWTF